MKKNLELYVHIPFCVKKCAYCDFLSFAADEQTQMDYADALIQEIRFYGSLFQSSDRFKSTSVDLGERRVVLCTTNSSAPLCHPPEVLSWKEIETPTKTNLLNSPPIEVGVSSTSKMKEYVVSTIFIGGGTPSWIDEDKMLEILDALHQNFHILPDAEISMECNPGTMTRTKMEKYKKAGINRLSIGLQSADNEELRMLGRIHTFEQFLRTYAMAREVGFDNINVDLISGIPYQTAEKFIQTLKKVIALKPNHISVYSLIIEPGTPFHEAYQVDLKRQEAGRQTQVLPTEDEICRIIDETKQFLKKAGYEQYEISNFSQPGFACKHNIGYWTRENYLGLGLGAASLIENIRYSNLTDLCTYIKETKNIRCLDEVPQKEFQQEFDISSSIEEGVSSTFKIKTNLHASMEVVPRYAQMEEFMFLGLRMKQGINREEFERNFEISIEAIYQNVLIQLKEEGLLEAREGRIFLTEKGEDVSNYVLAQFLLSEP